MNPGQGLRFFFVPNIVTTAFYGIKFEEFFFSGRTSETTEKGCPQREETKDRNSG